MIVLSDTLSKRMNSQQMRDEWVYGLADQQGILIARSALASTYVGKPAAPSFQKAIQTKQFTPHEATTLEGIVGTFLVTPVHGGDWHLGVIVPNAVLNAPLNDLFLKLALLTALWLGLGLLISEVAARYITGQVEKVVKAVQDFNSPTSELKSVQILEFKRIYDQFRLAHSSMKLMKSDLALSASELDKANDLYENAPCGYHSLDREGRFIKINQTELEWLGYRREDLIGQPLSNLLSSASLELFKSQFPILLSNGKLGMMFKTILPNT
jgi:PAS domain-containing protein